MKWWSRKSRHSHDSVQAPEGTERATAPSTEDQPPARFTKLPERVDPKDTVAGQRVDPPRDPEGGRDTERDFMLRYGAGGDDTPWDISDG
jgi:hypothetical protein